MENHLIEIEKDVSDTISEDDLRNWHILKSTDISKLRTSNNKHPSWTSGTGIYNDINYKILHDKLVKNNGCDSYTDASSISSYSQSIIDYINEKENDYLLTLDIDSDIEGINSFKLQKKAKSIDSIDKCQVNKNQTTSTKPFKHKDESDSRNSSFYLDKKEMDLGIKSIILNKAELFEKYLLKLEEEVKNYREESKKLRLQRQQFTDEHKKLQDIYLKLQEEQDILKNEKEKLTEEKNTFKGKIKQAYQKVFEKLLEKSKEDQYQINLFQNQQEELKDQFLKKESEWSIINGRLKSQIRVLQIENSKLKEEFNNKKQNNVKCKKKVPSLHENSSDQNDLANGKKSCSKNKDDRYFQVPAIIPSCNKDSKLKVRNNIITAESITRKKNLYETLIKEAVVDLTENQPEKNASLKTTEPAEQSINNKEHIKEIKHDDGSIEYQYINGNVKIIYPDEGRTKITYYNGDIQEIYKNGTTEYFYASSKILHTTTLDGFEIFEFPDGQIEKRQNDGSIEITFPDGLVKTVYADGFEKWVLIDGTIIQLSPEEEKVIIFPNGQKEIHTKEYKRLEFPDGTMKIIYPEGIQETRYINGRINIKDKYGNFVMDTHL